MRSLFSLLFPISCLVRYSVSSFHSLIHPLRAILKSSQQQAALFFSSLCSIHAYIFVYSQPTGQQHQTLIIEEFEPDVFRQLIEYIHTGQVLLQPRTLLGVMNASDYYDLQELRKACSGFVQTCINVDTVCALLSSAEKYIQYKCTKSLVQKVLEFVDEHGNEVLNLGSFTLLPQHVVRLILAREELQADEFTKFQAALMWSKKFCDTSPVGFKNIHARLIFVCLCEATNDAMAILKKG